MKTLSLVMIVKNEADNLEHCLNHATHLVDEMVIVDTGSTDNTKDIALKYDARVFDFPWENDFAAARNYGLDQAKGDWIIVLDADEMIDTQNEQAEQALRTFINGEQAIGRLKILNKTLNNQGMESIVQSYVSRVFPKGIRYVGRIHEQLDTDLTRIKLPIEVKHHGYYQTNKFARNIELLELELAEHPEDSYLLYQIAKEYRGQGEPEQAYTAIKNAYNLIRRDESFYPPMVVEYIYILKELSRFSEGLELIVAEQFNLKDYPDFHFSMGLFYLDFIINNPTNNLHFLVKIENAYKRCIEIGETSEFDTTLGTGSFAALYNLGVFYEVQGKHKEALQCYEQSARYNYEPALQRLNEFGK